MQRFSRSGLEFPVVDGGPADGVPVVLLHGFPQTARAFDRVVPRLHDAGLRTLVPTQRGYTPTARPARRRDYTVTETAADVLALLDAAGADRAHLVGHDWGAAPVWQLAASAPDRIRSATVLSTPHPRALRRAMIRSDQGRRSRYMAYFQLPVLPERSILRSMHQTLVSTGLSRSVADDYVSVLTGPGAATGALHWYRGLPFARAAGPSRVPTTYVWGRRDFALGPWAAHDTARWIGPGVPYRFVELDAGHWLPETAPDAVAAAVLDRVG